MRLWMVKSKKCKEVEMRRGRDASRTFIRPRVKRTPNVGGFLKDMG